MITLALDAATYVASVAVFDGTTLRAADRVTMRGADEERLLPAVARALAAAGCSPGDVARIVCGAGPGSFTSLRIAASIAKGIATARNIPLFAPSSLAFVAAAAMDAARGAPIVAALDALRGEHYVGTFQSGPDGQVAHAGPIARWPSAALQDRAAAVGVLAGPGLPVPVEPDVRTLPRLTTLLAAEGPVVLSAWEPAYGRLAEAQVKWEAAHGRPLSTP